MRSPTRHESAAPAARAGDGAPIANARMYSIDPASTRAWVSLLEWILARAALPSEILDYPAPKPLSALWARDDLGAVLMCGLPYALRDPTPQLIAAPIPSPERYADRAVYMTDLVVRADAPFRRIEDTFGGIAGYTLKDSQSGYFAFRHLLRPFHDAAGRHLYREVVGDLINARGVIDALAAGRIDVGPLDSYCHDLLKLHQPEYAAQVRVVASTGPTPIPAFVATALLATADIERLRRAFVDSGSAGELADVRAALLLRGFALPERDDYAVLRQRRDALIARPELW